MFIIQLLKNVDKKLRKSWDKVFVYPFKAAFL